MPRDDDDRVLSRRVTFAVLLTVVALIAIVLLAQRIPHAERPTIQQPTVTTVIITHTPTR